MSSSLIVCGGKMRVASPEWTPAFSTCSEIAWATTWGKEPHGQRISIKKLWMIQYCDKIFLERDSLKGNYTNLSILSYSIHFDFPSALDEFRHHNRMVLNLKKKDKSGEIPTWELIAIIHSGRLDFLPALTPQKIKKTNIPVTPWQPLVKTFSVQLDRKLRSWLSHCTERKQIKTFYYFQPIRV